MDYPSGFSGQWTVRSDQILRFEFTIVWDEAEQVNPATSVPDAFVKAFA